VNIIPIREKYEADLKSIQDKVAELQGKLNELGLHALRLHGAIEACKQIEALSPNEGSNGTGAKTHPAGVAAESHTDAPVALRDVTS